MNDRASDGASSRDPDAASRVSEPHDSLPDRHYRPSRKTLFWYAVGAAPGGVWGLTSSYVVFYYNQVLGVPGSLIGLAALAAALFDAVTDPVTGALSDRTRTRWGRRHPYLFVSAIPIGLVFWAIWLPRGDHSVGFFLLWLLLIHLLKRLVDTAFTVPYLALGAEISSNYEERTRITTARATLYQVGAALGGGTLLLVFLQDSPEYPNGQLNPEAYPVFGAIFGALTAVSLLASAWFTRDWVSHLSKQPAPHVARLSEIWTDLRDLLQYRAFRRVALGAVSRNIAGGASGALGIYMATFFWRVSSDILALWGVSMFVGLFTGLRIWLRLSQHYEKRTLTIAADSIYLAFFCIPYLLKIVGFWPTNDSDWYIPLYVLTTGFLAHVGIASSGALTGSMLGDVTDLDELEHGKRREGVILGAESFASKALTGFSPLVVGIVVDSVGLSQSVAPEAVGDSVVTALGLAQGGVMVAFFGAAILFVRGYDLDKARHDRILAQLDLRSAQGVQRSERDASEERAVLLEHDAGRYVPDPPPREPSP